MAEAVDPPSEPSPLYTAVKFENVEADAGVKEHSAIPAVTVLVEQFEIEVPSSFLKFTVPVAVVAVVPPC
jgi:hypothetical protein